MDKDALVDRQSLETHRAWLAVQAARRGHAPPRVLQAWVQAAHRLAHTLRLRGACDEAELLLRDIFDELLELVGNPGCETGTRIVAHECLAWSAGELADHLSAHGLGHDAETVRACVDRVGVAFTVPGGYA
jgi:hypothetical protein